MFINLICKLFLLPEGEESSFPSKLIRDFPYKTPYFILDSTYLNIPLYEVKRSVASNNSVVCYIRIEISEIVPTWANKIRLVLTDISSLKSISSKSRYSGASIILLWTFWVSQHSSKDLIKKTEMDCLLKSKNHTEMV